MPKLNAKQVARRMKAVPLWVKRGRSIRREFEFVGFMGAIGFVNRVARAAERADHHPDIDVRWNKVTLTLSTHSEGGLTAKDFSMARRCSAIFSRHFGRSGK
jgi:4a-hydroxytetrahydrobiopterin dehydratase